MAISPTSPITGAAQTGLTSPTYTFVADTPPNGAANGKQYAITALGGTQTGVTVNSISMPFTLTFFKPAKYAVLGPVSPVNGLISGVIPKNKHTFIIRKGVNVNASQTAVADVEVSIRVPAGADTFDASNVRAMLSAAIGLLSQISSGTGDTVVSGVM